MLKREAYIRPTLVLFSFNNPSPIYHPPSMDFLKSAVATAIAKGSSFPCSLGDRVDIDNSIWTLHNATKRVSQSLAWAFAEADAYGL